MLVRTPNWLGDALMATPVYYNLTLRQKIYLLAHKNIAPLFKHFPSLEVFPYEPNNFLKNWQRVRQILRSKGLREGLLLPNSFSSALLFFLAGVPERMGYATDLRGPLLTKAIKKPKDPMHQVDYYLQLLSALGIPVVRKELYFPVEKGLSERGRRILEEHGLKGEEMIALLAPGAAYGEAKRWPTSYFRELAKILLSEGIKVLVVGGEGEILQGEEIVAGLKGALNLCGKTALEDLPGVFLASKVLVSNDSGLMHLGAALSLPQVAIFGSTSPELTGPRNKKAVVLKVNLPCSPCGQRTCKYSHYRCLREISPKMVWEAVKELLSAYPHQLKNSPVI